MIPKSLLIVKIGMETKFPAYMKNGEHYWIEESTGHCCQPQYMQSRILVLKEERCISIDLGIYYYRCEVKNLTKLATLIFKRQATP